MILRAPRGRVDRSGATRAVSVRTIQQSPGVRSRPRLPQGPAVVQCVGNGFTNKYLSKNNFIFISEILEYIFYVVNQMPPAFIGIEFDPLILHKTPQYLNTIQFWRIFWKIKDIQAFLFL